MGTNLFGVAGNVFEDLEFRFPEHAAKIVMRHLLLALDYCHNECDIIHTGQLLLQSVQTFLSHQHIDSDIKISNVMSTFGAELNATDTVLYANKAESHSFNATDGLPATISESDPVGILPKSATDLENWKKITFKLVDFGVGAFSALGIGLTADDFGKRVGQTKYPGISRR